MSSLTWEKKHHRWGLTWAQAETRASGGEGAAAGGGRLKQLEWQTFGAWRRALSTHSELQNLERPWHPPPLRLLGSADACLWDHSVCGGRLAQTRPPESVCQVCQPLYGFLWPVCSLWGHCGPLWGEFLLFFPGGGARWGWGWKAVVFEAVEKKKGGLELNCNKAPPEG